MKNHIIEVVDASSQPVYVAVWGGAHDLAQALFDVRAERSPEGDSQKGRYESVIARCQIAPMATSSLIEDYPQATMKKADLKKGTCAPYIMRPAFPRFNAFVRRVLARLSATRADFAGLRLSFGTLSFRCDTNGLALWLVQLTRSTSKQYASTYLS